MTQIILLVLFFLCSCSGELKSSKKTKASETTISKSTSLASDDTVFIHRETTSNYYHAIYIEKNRESTYYKWLTNFEFSEDDKATYHGSYKYINKKNPNTFKSINKTDIPKKWIPVYLYKNQYYLYSPSDWGNAGKRIINDSAFVYWYMDGPLPVPIESAEKTNSNEYLLKIMSASEETPTSKKLTIYTVNPKTKLSVFEFSNEQEENYYELYVPVESAKYFDMIVNFSNQKQMEFDFDEIDFEKLLINRR